MLGFHVNKYNQWSCWQNFLQNQNEESTDNRLQIKGQLILIEEWKMMFFLGCPFIHNLKELIDNGLFISDMSTHGSHFESSLSKIFFPYMNDFRFVSRYDDDCHPKNSKGKFILQTLGYDLASFLFQDGTQDGWRFWHSCEDYDSKHYFENYWGLSVFKQITIVLGNLNCTFYRWSLRMKQKQN